MTTVAPNQSIRSVRLEPDALQDIYLRVDSISQDSRQLTSERYRYRLKSCVVQMQQVGSGSFTSYQVPTYDLSANGMGFLHGGYLHPGTRCQFQLITTFGTWIDIAGCVAQCKHIQGLVHIIDVKFDQPIHPADFCEEANKVQLLLAEDDDMMFHIFRNYLGMLGGDVVRALNGKEAVEKALLHHYDILFMDIEMPVMDGLTAVRTLREKGYVGLIVACTGRTQPKDRIECIEAGCNDYLPKPYTKESLETLLQSIKNEPIISSFHHDPAMHEMIDACVADFIGKLKLLELALTQQDITQLAEITRKIKVQAGCCGFELIMQMAIDLEVGIHANMSLTELKQLVMRVSKTCYLARPSGKKQSR